MSVLKMTTAIVSPIFLWAAAPAWAGDVVVNVPEPSMLGLVALVFRSKQMIPIGQV